MAFVFFVLQALDLTAHLTALINTIKIIQSNLKKVFY